MPLLFPLLHLLACGGDIAPVDNDDLVDTGAMPVCGRVRGTGGVLLYQDDATVVRTPKESPRAEEVGTGIAGPFDGEGRDWLVAVGGKVLRTDDAGCNWSAQGTLGSGDWALTTSADLARVYAFDRGSGRGAWSEDAGASWTSFDAGQAFAGEVSVDLTSAGTLRGVQGRGLVESLDGGATWSVTGALPATMGALRGSARAGETLAWVAGEGGAGGTVDGGAAWTNTFDAGDASRVVLASDDPARVWLLATTTDGLLATWTAGGTTDGARPTWDRALDEAQAPIAQGAPIWPIPGSPTKALSMHGPVTNDAGETAVNLYIMEAGVGTRTVRVGTFRAINDVRFGSDRWVAAVTPSGD